MLAEWFLDCVGFVWAAIGLLLLAVPLVIALVDPILGLTASLYAVFLLWRGWESWHHYSAARRSGTSRAEWRRDEAAALTAAREHMLNILDR